MERLKNGENGDRDGSGRFTTGNRGGPGGNPHAAAAARFRKLLAAAVSDEDFQAIVQAVIRKARKGDLRAARMVLDRTLGPSGQQPAADEGEGITVIFQRSPMRHVESSPIERVGATPPARA